MKKKKTPPQATPRFDLGLKDSDYIAKVPRPNFDMTRDERLADGYRRGLPLSSLMKSSGYTPRQLFAKLGLDETGNYRLFDELQRIYDESKGKQDGRPTHL